MINDTINMLGYRAKDKVTDFEGTISSVCFDLYGCVQCTITAPKGSDGKLGESYWFDVHRLEIVSSDRVMGIPDFAAVARKPEPKLTDPAPLPTAPAYGHGPAEKPSRRA